MKELEGLSHEFLLDSNADAVGVAILDFKKHEYSGFEILNGEVNHNESKIFFDYASLTKPLTNSFSYIAQDFDDNELKLLLNHRAGIPAWGLLAKSSWRDQLNSYPIKESKTVYSDFSALRFMLDVEEKLGKNYHDIVFDNLDPSIKFWRDLSPGDLTLQNGFYRGKENIGKVHDPNAYNLGCFTSHAGLFGTVKALGSTLLNFNKKYDLLNLMNKNLTENKERFCLGFDTVSDPNNTLAGKGCSAKTFGHLGFTGTSFWIDSEKQLGHIILTNSTKYFWFDKLHLNQFRRELGAYIWQNF